MTRAQRVQHERKADRPAALTIRSRFGETATFADPPMKPSDPAKFPFEAIGPELWPRTLP